MIGAGGGGERDAALADDLPARGEGVAAKPGRGMDGDGMADGQDTCPDLAYDAKRDETEESQIVQRAIFATFGITGSRYALLVDTKMKPVHFWGYPGAILYKWDAKKWPRGQGGIFLSWTVKIDGDSASVWVHDYEGSLAAGGQEVKLRKINGQWYAVKRELGPVS